ncbi:MAG: Na+/H+ antiporter [Candidatus Altiarchaeota archaeon]|nr:Na+/H+ antiporter [Candidatus Altiarchaeota archaeon]
MIDALVLTEKGFIFLLLIAVLVAIAVKYIRLPYTIALVLCGAVIGVSGVEWIEGIELSEELILFIFLPALLFEGAIHMDFDKLKENSKVILVLAVVGLTLGIFIVGYLLHYFTGIDFIYCLLFGAMIMPTDPVSVLALFKKLGVPKRLSMIVEGESLFNDGTGIVIFGVILGMINTHSKFDVSSTVITFLMVVLGGLLIGFITGYAVYRVLRKIDDHLIEVVLTGILAYGTFLVCESLHVSGVMGVVAAGLLIGNRGTVFAMSPTTRIAIQDSWELMAFIINSLIFLMIGIYISKWDILLHMDLIALAIAIVVITRAITVYPLIAVINLKVRNKIPASWMHVINLGGIHGSIPIALLLSLSEIPHLEELSFMVFGVVLFSLVVQGLSIEPLINWLRLSRTRPETARYMGLITRKISTQQALNELKAMRDNKEVPLQVYHKLRKEYEDGLSKLAGEIKKLIEEYPEIEKGQTRYARKRMLLARKSSIQHSIMKGITTGETAAELIQEIDAELERE